MKQTNNLPYFVSAKSKPLDRSLIAVILFFAMTGCVAAPMPVQPVIQGEQKPGKILATPQASVSWGQSRVNILVIGVDQRSGESVETSRADSILLIGLEPSNNTVVVFGLSRDIYVLIPGNSNDRISQAHALGGPRLMSRTIEAVFNIPIHHYVRLNFEAFVRIVDLLDGIDIQVDAPIADNTFPNERYGHETFALPIGLHRLNGRAALKYVRVRRGSSNFARMQRQLQVIQAFQKRLIEKTVDVTFIPDLLSQADQIGQFISSDLTINRIFNLAMAAKSLSKEQIIYVSMDEYSVENHVVAGVGTVLIPNKDRLNELRRHFLAKSD